MKRLLLAFLLLPIFGIGQKITRIVNPEDHSLWLMTDDANLKTGVGPGQIGVHFRVEGPSVYLYIWGNVGEVGERDWAAFITGTDTIMAHATGRRTRILFDEYIMENGGLTKLARSPVTKVMLSNLEGFQEKDVPEKNKDRLMIYAAALLREMGG